MVVEWTKTAQLHWIVQADYCAETFGGLFVLEFAKKAEEKIDRICKFPESGTREHLLKEKDSAFRYVYIQKRIQLIYRLDEELQIVYIVDVWDTRMDPQHLLDRMK